MKRMIIAATAVCCLLLTFFSVAQALDIDMGIGIGAPPVKYANPPDLVPIPGRYVYFAPDIDITLFFYHGLWYRSYKGRWFRSENYTGSWENIGTVPPALLNLPRNYRAPRHGYSRIPYGELISNWERWERERYWDKGGDDRRMRERQREREERDVRPERRRDRY
jgi:hypothetical protein